MGKRGKGKSVKNNKNTVGEPDELVQAPHSFVIHKGLPGGNISNLTRDFRRVMEPFTASVLRESKRNTLKDFVSVAGPLHVSHLCVFSQTEMGAYLKVARLPRGPTLTFKLHNFCLSRDVVSALKKQQVIEQAFKHSPLIVLNGFSGEGMHMKLMASMFQNMFPTINLANVDLNTIRRCVLLNYNPGSKLIDFRHFTIKIAPVGLSKGVKKVVQGKVPNLSKFDNISEFLTKSNLLSESEGEDDPAHHVTLPQKIISRGNVESGQSAIRLTELGPRINMLLIKIEDGLMDGQILYHELVQKTEQEQAEIQRKRLAKRKLKESRKSAQKENTDRKEAKKQDHKEKSLKGMRKETDHLMKVANRESNLENPVEEDNDAEYYREEVGAEPEEDLFSSLNRAPKRPHQSNYKPNKKPRLETSDKPPRFTSKPAKSYAKKKEFGAKSPIGSRFKTKAKKPPMGGTKKSDDQRPTKRETKGKMRKGGKGVDKTNAAKRDQRPIGGGNKKKK